MESSQCIYWNWSSVGHSRQLAGGTPFPIFDVEDPDRGVFEDYNITGYPIVFKICPDGIVERIFTSEIETQIYEKVQECQAALSIK